MPYQIDGLVTDYDETIAAGPLYDLSTMSIDTNRPLTTQVMVLFYFTTFTDSTTVSSQTWNNWYDPYLVPKSSLVFEDSTQTVTLDLTNLGTAINSSGAEFTRPQFSTGTKVRLMRAQDISNISHTFAAGSRVTSAALNNSVGQIFKSMQEVEDRLVKVEGATFEQPIPLNSSSNELKVNGGIVLESDQLALDLAASSITNSLPYTKLSGTPILGTSATLDVGTGASQIVQMTADGKLPVVNGSNLTDIPGVTPPTQGIANTNTVKIDSASVASGEYAKFTASGLESKTTGEVLTDIGAAAASHNQALSTITGTGGAAALNVGTIAGTVAAGDDARLSNTRDPNAHNQALSTISDAGGAAALDVGTGIGTVAAGDDSRLSDARTPSSTLDHDASKITTGTLVVGRGGTGLTSVSTLLNSNTTKSDVGLSAVENTALTTWAGSGNITTVGAIIGGSWGGTAIDYSALSGTPTLGTASASATGDFVAASAVSTFGGTLIDDADAATARATLGVPAINHDHSGGNITSGLVADTYVDLRVDSGVTFDGQGSVIAGSKTVLVPIERACVISAVSIVGDVSGSITVDLQRYTPTGLGALVSPTTLGSIALSSRQHIRDTTLSGWTKSLSVGDVLSFTTSGTIATVTRVTVKTKLETS